jgi:hypothetical protein
MSRLSSRLMVFRPASGNIELEKNQRTITSHHIKNNTRIRSGGCKIAPLNLVPINWDGDKAKRMTTR